MSSSSRKPQDTSIPVLMLLESINRKVRIDTTEEESYEGVLDSCQENMNCQLVNVVKRAKNGEVSRQQSAFIRGTNIAFVKLPNVLQKNPIFKAVKPTTNAETKSN